MSPENKMFSEVNGPKLFGDEAGKKIRFARNS